MEHGDEIKPVEHLLQPLDEDGPIKCPVLDSFPLLDQSMWKEIITDGLQKRKDPFAEREHVTQSSSKRIHYSPGCVFICVKTQLNPDAYLLTL
ncbi:hypothetical protein IHE45_19G069200 [Dioscorea alata]|uniref:Uncharacterized protein n=1 Tax=Dioscorea alata TaxID=55571 RepID=A0ACB7TZ25_DIOAL|nr:hypothetical protein IHE45_19G069200 [Dioscorea alata]